MKNLFNFPAVPPISQNKIPIWMMVILGLATAIGPLATDMYLPAFPKINHDLVGYGDGSAQMTLAIWFIGLAIGQFSIGPLSDRYGRRVPLFLGMLIFTLASIGCAIVTNFYLFCLYRFFASLGGSAGMVIARAMVRDVSSGSSGIRMMAQLALMGCIVPIAAPTLGSFIVASVDWRWLFWIMTLYGTIESLVILFYLPDTLPKKYRIQSSFRNILWQYVRIGSEPIFASNTLITSFANFIIFAYLSGTPMVLSSAMHFTPLQLGIWFGINSIAIAGCNQINSFLIRHRRPATLLNFGVCVASVAGVSFIIIALLPLEMNFWKIFLSCCPIVIIMGSLGFIFPNCTIFAFTLHGRRTGSASALLGTVQFLLGSISSTLMSFMPNHSMLPTASVICFGVIGMLLCNLWRKKSTAAILTKVRGKPQNRPFGFGHLLKDLD